MQKFILSDIEKCTGCGRCTLACSGVKTTVFEPTKSRIHFVNFPREGLSVPNICFHCENPACAEACPTGALIKLESGEVFRSPSLCVGCRSCAIACPFGVIRNVLDSRRVPKCDGCADLVDAGRVPLCVSVCPASALEFVPKEQLEKEELLGVDYKGYHPFWRRS